MLPHFIGSLEFIINSKVNELSGDSQIDCQEEDTPLQHPFYWGAWICQGNTEPLTVRAIFS